MNRTRFAIGLLTLLAILNAPQNLAGNPEVQERKVSGAIKVLPFSPSEVVLKSSWIKQREALNTTYLRQLDPERLLHNFRVNAGLPSTAKPLEGWESPECGLRGHFTGHYLSACAALIAKDGDALLSKRIGYMIDELAVCQQKMGGNYLSAFPESEFDTLEKKYGGVWAPYYTLHKIMQGLLDVYTVTGNPKAYQVLLNLADYVEARMSKLPEAEIEKILYSAEANPTNEAGGMNEVLHNLYAVSKDPKHLKLAEIFDRKWFYQPLMDGKDILSGLHSNTHIVLVNGFARRFENTTEADFRKAAENFWDMLLNHHAYVNGSSSGPRPIATTPTSRIAEHWGHADHLSATLTGEIAESCVTHNTQKLTANLFQWTANPEYADAYMNTFYNAVLPIQNSENGSVVYHLPLGSPRTKNFLTEQDYKCCNGSGIEAFAHLNSNIYFHDQGSLWVNLFMPSAVNWKEKGIRLEQTTNFPEEQKVRFTVSAEQPTNFALKLLIPSWANAQTRVLVNGQPVKTKIKPLSFATIDRTWKTGDTVELIFDYQFHLKNMPDNPNVVALFYGPVLLAFETDKELILKGSQEQILQSVRKQPEGYSFILKNNGIDYKLVPFYQITKVSYGVYATIRNDY
ncbi:MAG: glycoside hydrolase family 127 protein [Prolixibacteraceae bacterium]|nr:glycoside hydrolase family 127 protein [Prolixibacteraceae bacterium]